MIFTAAGRLAMSPEGLAARDRFVLTACRDAGIPVAVTMAGGYARDTEDTVTIHLATVHAAASLSRFGRAPDPPARLPALTLET